MPIADSMSPRWRAAIRSSTRPDYAYYVEQFLIGKRRTRLSRAALETLATIAYRQPITRGQIEELRGVDSGGVLHTLMSRDLVAVKGRSEDLGRPLLYATTAEFLAYFGLNSLRDLPNLEEFEALSAEDPLEDPEIRSTLESHGLLTDPESEGEKETDGVSAETASMETDPSHAGENEDQDTPEEADARNSVTFADDQVADDQVAHGQVPDGQVADDQVGGGETGDQGSPHDRQQQDG